MPDLVRVASTLVAVLAVVGGALRGLDALPGWWLGVGRSGVLFDGVEPLERAVGRPLLLPAYFPDALAWPPARVVLDRRLPRAAMVEFVGREDGREALRIWQAIEGDTDPPEDPTRLSGTRLHDVPVPLHDDPQAHLWTVRLPDGRVWDEVTLRRAGRWVVVHSSLPADQTMRLADSLR